MLTHCNLDFDTSPPLDEGKACLYTLGCVSLGGLESLIRLPLTQGVKFYDPGYMTLCIGGLPTATIANTGLGSAALFEKKKKKTTSGRK